MVISIFFPAGDICNPFHVYLCTLAGDFFQMVSSADIDRAKYILGGGLDAVATAGAKIELLAVFIEFAI